jgi:hypothetical protein
LFLIAGMLIFRAVTIYLRIANLDNCNSHWIYSYNNISTSVYEYWQ